MNSSSFLDYIIRSRSIQDDEVGKHYGSFHLDKDSNGANQYSNATIEAH